MKYPRILLKLSGEALMGQLNSGIDSALLNNYMDDIKSVVEKNIKVGIVIGGGNIFRGVQGTKSGFDRTSGDYMGMLATVINGLAIQDACLQAGMRCKLLTAIRMEPVGELYSREKVEQAFSENQIVVFSAGTGNPFFTTDTAAALRAVEMKADVLLKGTRVDGIYTADPEKDKTATKYTTLSFDEAYSKNLKIMDLTAFTLCRENNLPIIVFDMNKKGNLLKVVNGENIGTLVNN